MRENVLELVKTDYEPEFEVERIALEQMRIGIKRAVPKTIFSDIHRVTANAIIQDTAEDMILTLNATVTTEKIERIEYPTNWFQALKERFLPAFILDIFPVIYKRYDVIAFYPKVNLEGEREIYFRYMEKGPYDDED